jgi:hypothetical protein
MYKRKKYVSEYNKKIDPYVESQYQYIFEVDEAPQICTLKNISTSKNVSSKIFANYDNYKKKLKDYTNVFGVKKYNPFE